MLKCSAHSYSPFPQKRFANPADMVIGIAVGNIIEVAANDHRVWALVDLLYAVTLCWLHLVCNLSGIY